MKIVIEITPEETAQLLALNTELMGLVASKVTEQVVKQTTEVHHELMNKTYKPDNFYEMFPWLNSGVK